MLNDNRFVISLAALEAEIAREVRARRPAFPAPDDVA